MSKVKKFLENYARFITKHPVIILFFVAIISVVSMYLSSSIETKSSDYRDMLPEGYEVIDALVELEENFGGSDGAKFSIEIDPSTPVSNEARDVRDPEILHYVDLLTQSANHIDDVIEANSASTLLKELNGGGLTKI